MLSASDGKPEKLRHRPESALGREEVALAQGIIQIVVGMVAIVFGFIADAFYPAFLRRHKPDEKPMPKWLGRTISAAVGVWFIISGISRLRQLHK
jgi:hypothetical protein